VSTCTCAKPEWHWRRQSCNERGWHCLCGKPAPNHVNPDEQGFRPDLDRELCREKAACLLLDLHMDDFVYVSNNDMGDAIAAQVAASCKRWNRYDQGTILLAIMTAIADAGHVKFWQAEAGKWLCGETKPKQQPEEQCEFPF
jgi:hypothetical protein